MKDCIIAGLMVACLWLMLLISDAGAAVHQGASPVLGSLTGPKGSGMTGYARLQAGDLLYAVRDELADPTVTLMYRGKSNSICGFFEVEENNPMRFVVIVKGPKMWLVVTEDSWVIDTAWADNCREGAQDARSPLE